MNAGNGDAALQDRVFIGRMVPPLGIEPSSAVYKTAASPQCFGGVAG